MHVSEYLLFTGYHAELRFDHLNIYPHIDYSNDFEIEAKCKTKKWLW